MSLIGLFTQAQETKLANIEVLADVTDETNVTTALNGATPGTITVENSDPVFLQDAGSSDVLKLANAKAVANLANSTTLSLFNALKIADLEGGATNINGGIADPFKDESNVDTATSTDEVYDAAGDFYTNTSATDVRVSGGTPTMPLGGTAADINDDDDGTTTFIGGLGNLSGASVAARIIAQIDFGSDKNIKEIQARGYYDNGGGAHSGCGFYHSTDGTNWTQMGSDFSINQTSTHYSVTGDVTARYVAVTISAINWSTFGANLAGLNGLEPSAPSNMILQSNTIAVDAVPSDATVLILIDPIDAITINTDAILAVSRDDGTSWTNFTLELVDTVIGTVALYRGDVDISGQTSGSNLKWRLTIANNKEIQLHGVLLKKREI